MMNTLYRQGVQFMEGMIIWILTAAIYHKLVDYEGWTQL